MEPVNGDDRPHVPPEQSWPAGQALPQAPQFWLLVWTSVHVPAQLTRPIWHERAHVPFEQT